MSQRKLENFAQLIFKKKILTKDSIFDSCEALTSETLLGCELTDKADFL